MSCNRPIVRASDKVSAIRAKPAASEMCVKQKHALGDARRREVLFGDVVFPVVHAAV
jgi:hypothetical protein